MDNLFTIGTALTSNSETIKKTILVNKICLGFIFLAIPFTCSIIAIKIYFIVIPVPFIIAGFIGSIYCNKLAKFQLAKIILYLNIMISVYFYAAVLGEYSGIQYVYLALVGFGYGILRVNEIRLRYAAIFAPVACFATLYLSNFWFFFTFNLTQSQLKPVFFTSNGLIFMVIWMTILFYEESSIRHKNNLDNVLQTYQLSERESEIFLLILDGKSNKTISQNLYIEEGTVKNHLTNIYKKLKMSNRKELMATFGSVTQFE